MFLSSRPSSGVSGFRYAGAFRNKRPSTSPTSQQQAAEKVTESNLSTATPSVQTSKNEHSQLAVMTKTSDSSENKPMTLPPSGEKLVIVMVGLPARGKSYIAKKVCRYLNWLQYPTRVFNVGEKRRETATRRNTGAEDTRSQIGTSHTAAFFDPNDEGANQVRERFAIDTLDELLEYLVKGGRIGIFDATNTTYERRDMIVNRVSRANLSSNILFIETQCQNQNIISSNINLKLSGPDYGGVDPVGALLDFNSRIWMYEKKYKPIGEAEELKGYSYCQIIDVGRKTILHNINDPLSAQTAGFLQHFHLYPRQIWLTRHGESEDDLHERLGGNSELSAGGQQYAKALSKFISSRKDRWNGPTSPHSWIDHSNSFSAAFEVWTSESQKSIQTAQFFDNSYHKKHLRILDELNAGALDGHSRADVPRRFREWFEKRELDKFNHRYPGLGGEAYHDLMGRLKNVVLDVEGSKNHILLVSGLAAIRALLAYFRGLSRIEIPELDVPQGALYFVNPQPYGVKIIQYRFNPANNCFNEIKSSAVEHLPSKPMQSRNAGREERQCADACNVRMSEALSPRPSQLVTTQDVAPVVSAAM